MAGTIQSLFFTPPPTKLVSLNHFNQLWPTKRVFFSSSSVTLIHHRQLIRPVKAYGASDQVDANGINKPSRNSGSGYGNGFSWLKPLMNLVANNFLPFALISGVTLGLMNPGPGYFADSYHLSKFCTFGIFFISGLTLRTSEIWEAAEAWPVGVYGLVSILFFTPYFSRILLQIQLQPQEFVTGLAIFSCLPTTISSGVALTQLAGGNSALALAMTVISNMLGILVVPFSISKFIADGIGVSVQTKQLFRSLNLMLLIPLTVGKVLRESFKDLADIVDLNRKFFSRISAIFLSLVPWIQVSRSRSQLLMVKPEIFLLAIGIGALLHFLLLAFNVLALQILSALSGGSQSVFSKRPNARTIILIASQKTLTVMVAVVEQLGGAFGDSGLLILPCIAAHLNQTIIDSFIVRYWLLKDTSANNAKVAQE